MPAIAHQNKILGNTSGGGSTILVTTSESTLYGQTVTLSDGTTTLTGTFSNAGECEFTGVMMVGTLTATSGTASTSINVPYFGVYSIILSLFSATITATYPEDKGATCTCTGNGESYTASGSPYTFTVHGAGEYRVIATLDGKSITYVIQITTDGQSETATINFGTIVVTYDNAFRGLPITCTKDSSVYTKTAPSSGNTMYFYPNIAGNWVISGTVSGTSYSKTANVTSLSTSVSVSLETVPDGKTTTPTDDIEKWLQCGQITGKSYTTLSQVLADAETYERLLSDSNACDYMKRSTTWASTICADADAMMRLGKYDYACDALLANSTWASAIANSTYFEYVLDVSVPVMTSNTTPSGECISYGANPSYPNYYAFDGNDSTYWVGNTPITTGAWIGYVFPTSVNVRVIKHLSSVGVEVTAQVEYSDDGTTYESTNVQYNISGSTGEKIVNIPNCGSHRYWRTNVVSAPSANGFATKSLQFYGRHTAQTDIIVTAHGGDTVYYMENGSPVTLTTADSDTGIGTVDWSDLPKGAITLYSSTAKNLSDLTADYSKTVYVTEYTTQIYLMPYEHVLYWFGHEDANLEDLSTTNGWSTSANHTFYAPTHNYTNIAINGGNGRTSGIGNKNAISGTTVHVIGITTRDGYTGDTNYLYIENNTSKQVSGGSNVILKQSAFNTLQYLSVAFTKPYLAVETFDDRDATIYAILYE